MRELLVDPAPGCDVDCDVTRSKADDPLSAAFSYPLQETGLISIGIMHASDRACTALKSESSTSSAAIAIHRDTTWVLRVTFAIGWSGTTTGRRDPRSRRVPGHSSYRSS